MSYARSLLVLMILSLTPIELVAATTAPASRDENIDVTLGWESSPPRDDEGHPLAPAVLYRLYGSRDGGPLSFIREVHSDTLCTIPLVRGSTYRIRVVGFDEDLRASVPSEYSDPIYFAPGGDITDVEDLPASGAALESTYPNPFNPQIRVRYAVSAQDGGAAIRLEILDVRGRQVKVLESGPRATGRHEAVWDGTDKSGRRSPSGSYFVRLQSKSGQQIRPITMVK
jgi:hypothetical protein